MSQLMPLPLTVSCFSKIQIGFTFLVPAHLGSPGKRAVKRVYVLQPKQLAQLFVHARVRTRCQLYGAENCTRYVLAEGRLFHSAAGPVLFDFRQGPLSQQTYHQRLAWHDTFYVVPVSSRVWQKSRTETRVQTQSCLSGTWTCTQTQLSQNQVIVQACTLPVPASSAQLVKHI